MSIPGRRARLTGAGLVILILVTALAAAGCGGGGNSTSSSGTGSQTSSSSNFNFGSNDPRRVTAFGDSITFGVLELKKKSSNLVTTSNYPNILQAMLQGLEAAWRVVNRGVPGEITSAGVSRFPSVLAIDRPGFILIMEGTNDASRGENPSVIVANLEAMVLAALGNRTIPIVGTIPPNFRNDPGAQDVIASANPLIRTMAAAHGAVLAEIFNGMNDRSLFGLSPDSDPLHPNERGYSVMAGIWFSAMQRAISKGAPAPSVPTSSTTTATQKPQKKK